MNYNNGHNVMGKEHMKIDLFSILYRGGIYLSQFELVDQKRIDWINIRFIFYLNHILLMCT